MMDDDERRIRARIHDALGTPQPPPGLRASIMASLPYESPEARRGQHRARLTTFTAATLAVMIVVALLSTSSSLRARLQSLHPPGRTPATQATPRPVAQATFWYQAVTADQGGGQGSQALPTGPLLQADWTGAALGSVAGLKENEGVRVSPDGQYLMAPANGVLSRPAPTPTSGPTPPDPAGARIVDDTGAVVTTSPTSLGMWADDSRHLCRLQLSGGGTPLALDIGDLVPGRGITHSRVMLSGANGSRPAVLIGCSFQSDRAVLLGGLTVGRAATNFAEIIQLTTGRVVLHLDLGPRGLTQPIVSPDGRYLAVNRGVSSASGGNPLVDILDLSSGRLVTHLNGVAVGFSGDGRLLALDTGLATGEGPASIVRWQTGQTTWTSTQEGLRVGDVRWLPHDADMALTVWHAGAVPDVVLVRGDGSARIIARQAMLLSVGTLGTNG